MAVSPNQFPKCPTEVMPAVLDREVSIAADDSFGHRHYADALRGLIESKDHKPPYSIGLLGGWGTGKSTIKALYAEGVTGATGADNRCNRIRAITFNAWRFGGEDIRRALLRDIFLQLGGDESEVYDHFFSQRTSTAQQPKRLKEIFLEGRDRVVFHIALLALLLLAAVLVTKVAAMILGLTSDQVTVWVLAVFTAFFAVSPKFIEKLSVSQYTDVTRIEFPKASAEQYEKLLVDKLAQFHEEHPSIERIAVFVDDLDRLSSEEMVDGLDAIRALMELPKSAVGMVFVLSCDEELVSEALSRRTRSSAELPGAISSTQDARRYLDRIFQFRLDVPPMPRMDMRAFALRLLSRPCFEQIRNSIAETDTTIDEVVSRLIHVGVTNPRNAIQLINAYTAAFWIAMKREFEGKAATRPGALAEGTVTRYPLTLAVLTVLKVDFPEFYRLLQEEPGTLMGFLDVFIRESDSKDQPGPVRSRLSKLADIDSETHAWVLKDNHAMLRQYLSSVQSVRFPESLQAHILLNQDETARRTGDAGARLYAPVISADIQGTLRALGKDQDELLLTPIEVDALASIWQLVDTETTQDRQENTAVVYVTIAPRASIQGRQKLIVPLGRILAKSASLRSRLGVARIAAILNDLKLLDRRAVSSALAEDYGIGRGSNLAATDAAGRPLTYEAATENINCLVDTLINELVAGMLTNDVKDKLLGWIVERDLVISGLEPKVLPFEFLDGWVSRHEDALLEPIGGDYARGVIEQIGTKSPSLLDRDRAVQRTCAVLRSLRLSDDDLWDICRLAVATADEDICLAAQKRVRESISDGADSDLDAVCVALAKRVAKNAKEADSYDDDDDAIRLISEICGLRASSLSSSPGEMAKAAMALSMNPMKFAPSVLLARAVKSASPTAFQTLTEQWIARAETDLPLACMEVVGEGFADLVDEARVVVSEKLLALRTAASAGAAKQLSAFWSGVTAAGSLAAPAVSAELVQALSNMVAAASGFGAKRDLWDEYGFALEHATVQQASAHLGQLLANAATVSLSYVAVMDFMKPRWTWWATLPGVDSKAIVQQCRGLIPGLAGTPECDSLFVSLASLAATKRIADEDVKALVAAISPIWTRHPETSSELLVLDGTSLWPTVIQGLPAALASDPERFRPVACRLLAASTKASDPALDGDVALFLLRESAVAVGGTSDALVHDFLGSLGSKRAMSLIALLDSGDLATEAKQRLLRALVRYAPEASDVWIEQVIGFACGIGDLSVVGEAVGKYASGRDEGTRFHLGSQLLGQLVSSQSTEIKRALAELIGNVATVAPVEAALKNVKLGLDDAVILSERFGGSRKLRRLVQQLKKSHTQQ